VIGLMPILASGLGASSAPDADVPDNLAAIRRRISSAGADIDHVTIVAVTKGFGPWAARAAMAAGIVDLGENYARELVDTAAQVGPGPRWHFLGPVQRNKVPTLAPLVDVWQAIDRVEAAESIARRRPGTDVMVQVNISGQATKHGCRPHDAPHLVGQLRQLDINVIGLMAVGASGAAAARPGFRHLAQLGRELGLTQLSMGMTDDLEVAVQEGATMIRIGRGLFGPRLRITPPETSGSNGGD